MARDCRTVGRGAFGKGRRRKRRRYASGEPAGLRIDSAPAGELDRVVRWKVLPRGRVVRRRWLALAIVAVSASAMTAQEHVILLHGLARTNRSMRPMQSALEQAGYVVTNVDYPSRTAGIAVLSETAIGEALDGCRRGGATKVHFVTHSLGGILVRSYLARHRMPELGRVVMLGPPNQGSEVVDALGDWRLFDRLNGPAGDELGTDSASVPLRLGAVDYCVGVVAGNRSINWINSLLIPGPDDGKVSVERTKLAGMTDHVVLPATHPFLMRNEAAIRQTVCFLRTGRFERDAAAVGSE